MVSTEEQNSPAGLADVAKLLRGVDLSSLRGVTSEYASPVVQALAAQEPAVAYAHEPNEVRETVRPGPTLAANNDNEKQEALEDLIRQKHGRIAEIRSQMGMALSAGAKERLAELLERLENAMGRKDIEEALRDASATLSSIHTGGSDKDDGVDAASIDAMHKNLYATDAEYRKVADEVTKDAAAVMERSKERRAASDEIAEKYGIKTDHDKDLQDLSNRYAKLEDKTTFEARRLELEIIKKEQEQNEARIAALKNDGRYEEAAKLEAERENINKDLNELKVGYFKQHDAYLEAYKRLCDQKIAQGMSKDEVDAEYQKEVEKMKKLASETLGQNDEDALKKLIERTNKETSIVIKEINASQNQTTEMIDNEILKSTVSKNKFQVTEASPVDDKVANLNQPMPTQNPGLGGLG